MWDENTRKLYCGTGQHYASDLSDDEWTIIEPLLQNAVKTGRPRKWPLRSIFNALLYLVVTGCQWRMLPKDFPPFQTVQNYFYAWRASGLFFPDQPLSGDGGTRTGRTGSQPFSWRN